VFKDLSKKIRVGICGASGYTGLALIKILINHPHAEIKFLGANSSAGQYIDDIFPELSPFSMKCEEFENISLVDIDLVFFATPNGFCERYSKELIERDIYVIDLSADHRFDDNCVYGLVEIFREEIIEKSKDACIIANPGCYTTSGILALAPILSSIPDAVDDHIIIDGKSGISGAGRKAETRIIFTELNENLSPYNLGGKHRHRPEFNRILSKIAHKQINVNFAPHLIPMSFGLLTTSYLKLIKNISIVEIRKIFNEYYEDEIFIKILDENTYPNTKWALKSNNAFLHLCKDESTNTLIISSAIDNIYKGASSQAVQNMNLVFELAENTGL
jgi:N-acetyl-gamma-glutamyl-phosphate reductase